MKQICLLIIVIIVSLFQVNLFAQNKVIGRILDKETKKPIFEASIVLENSKEQTRSNFSGFFEISAEPDNILIVKAKGYLDGYVEVPAANSFQLELVKNIIPDYKGGMQAFQKDFATAIRYPAAASTKKMYSKVYAQFEVDSVAGIQNIKVFNDPGNIFGQEIRRVLLKDQKNWVPKAKTAVLVLPVTFIVNQKENKLAEPSIELPSGEMLGEVVVTTSFRN